MSKVFFRDVDVCGVRLANLIPRSASVFAFAIPAACDSDQKSIDIAFNVAAAPEGLALRQPALQPVTVVLASYAHSSSYCLRQ